MGDFGCGDGLLTRDLLTERGIELVVAIDVSARALELTGRRLRLERMTEQQRGRIRIFQSALTYRDERWSGVDAAALVEVIEHLDLDRLPMLEQVVFGSARPASVLVTTPNAEYNALFPHLAAGTFRHPDHRFEWTRAEFQAWAAGIEATYGYRPAFSGIGRQDATLGTPTQMAVFTR